MFGKLESLRGIAACLVVLFHSSFNFGLKPLAFISNSYLFVDFFFILSGFVMSYAYGRKIREGLSFKNYIFLRLGRIYPLHLFMLLVWLPYIIIKQYLYISGYGGHEQFGSSNLFTFITNLFLLHSMGLHTHLSWNGPSWSISTEFFSYIAFFLLTVTIDRKNNLFLPLIISFLCYLFLFNLGRNNFDITYDYGFIRCLGAFYLGVYLFRHRVSTKISFTSVNLISMLEATAISILIVAVTYSDLNNVSITIAIASFIFVLAVFSTANSGYFGKILETKIMRAIGVWSFSIYMIHSIILAGISNVFEYLLKFDLNSSLGFVSIVINILIVSIIIIISRFTYIHIEKKFRDLVKLKIYKPSQLSSD
jgi:peptidoglycan/LPS O-acetylase OafA/YrhL